MRKLIMGLQQFRSKYVSTHQELLEQLSRGQKPKVLFITCSDSRIDPNRLTNTDLGDLFVIRNAGNIIPPYGAANGGEGATLEYAIHALGIGQIVVCGHSHCGAMKGLLQVGELEQKMPLVYDWLKHAEATRRLVVDNYHDRSKEELLEIMIAENVLTQIQNLKTYPVVRSKLFDGSLKIYAWIYLIETGEVFAYDPKTHSYLLPQNMLSEEEGPINKEYSTANVQPVACELPWHEDSETLPVTAMSPGIPSLIPPASRNNGSSKGSSSNGSRNGNSHDKTSEEFPALWLSPEQADRIYRGRQN